MDILPCLNNMLPRDAAAAVTTGKKPAIAPIKTNSVSSLRNFWCQLVRPFSGHDKPTDLTSVPPSQYQRSTFVHLNKNFPPQIKAAAAGHRSYLQWSSPCTKKHLNFCAAFHTRLVHPALQLPFLMLMKNLQKFFFSHHKLHDSKTECMWPECSK